MQHSIVHYIYLYLHSLPPMMIILKHHRKDLKKQDVNIYMYKFFLNIIVISYDIQEVGASGLRRLALNSETFLRDKSQNTFQDNPVQRLIDL